MAVESELRWKNSPKNMGNRLHSICSYMAMFPPSLPNFFINKYSKEKDIVLDPFSGRGTTILEACLLNRIGIGNDRNKLAYVLTKAKTNVPQKGRIVSRINKLESEFDPDSIEISGIDENIKMVFNEFTLKQMLFLKRNLKWETSNVDTFITAMLLGIMHGNSDGYLSLSMPNTFSMAPNYVKNYIASHNLVKPKRDAFDRLRKKLENCYQRPKTQGRSLNKDARKLKKIKTDSVDLIITSPPYLRVIKYGQFNWIRLWFFDEKGKDADKHLFTTESISRYKIFMSDVLNEMKRVLKPGAKAILVIGDVRNRESGNIDNLADLVFKECAVPLGFRLAEPIIADAITEESKVSKIWGDKKGNATKIDRIIVLSKAP